MDVFEPKDMPQERYGRLKVSVLVLFRQGTSLALDCDYQLILWLGLGWVVSLEGCRNQEMLPQHFYVSTTFLQQRVSGGIAGAKGTNKAIGSV